MTHSGVEGRGEINDMKIQKPTTLVQILGIQ